MILSTHCATVAVSRANRPQQRGEQVGVGLVDVDAGGLVLDGDRQPGAAEGEISRVEPSARQRRRGFRSIMRATAISTPAAASASPRSTASSLPASAGGVPHCQIEYADLQRQQGDDPQHHDEREAALGSARATRLGWRSDNHLRTCGAASASWRERPRSPQSTGRAMPFGTAILDATLLRVDARAED